MAPQTVLIVGNGIAGPTLASFLLLSPLPAAEKPHITILERSPQPRHQGQAIDVRGAGVAIIRKLGLVNTIRSCTTGEEGVHFVDERNRAWASFGAAKEGGEQRGTSDIEILRGRLADICYQRCRSISDDVKSQGGKGVDFIFGDSLESIDQDGSSVHVRLAKSGRQLSFDVIVGADGLQSRTRVMTWGKEGEDARVNRLGPYMGFFTIPAEKKDGTWRRWYRAPGRRSVMMRPSDRRDKTSVNMSVINLDDKRWRQVADDGRQAVEGQKALIAEYFSNAGWECPRLMKGMMAADDFYYDMVAQIKMDRWSRGRVVLLGDAGYCASPISGMGTTLALTGAYTLAGALSSYPDNLPAAFEQYQENMLPIVTKAQKLNPLVQTMMWPETSWQIFFLNVFFAFICYSGLAGLMFKLVGPKADEVQVKDYGFTTLSEWDGYEREEK